MRDLLDTLTPALQVLAEEVDVLPATGIAVEDLQQPDIDELEDKILDRGFTKIDMIVESPSQELYRRTPPLPRHERHLFRYFLDGSRQSYFIGTAIEHDRTTPIQLAQVGAAIVHREDDGRLSTVISRRKILLLLSKQQLSDAVWNKLAEACHAHAEHLELVDISEEDILNGPTTEHIDLRSRGGGKVNYAMHKLEIELAEHVPHQPDAWMIVDGSVKFTPSIEAPYVIGVAKSFSKEPQFDLKIGRRHEKFNITQLLARLPAEHRTAVFSGYNGAVAFWYVRLREQGQVDYPLMGVVKVELLRKDDTPVDSELADLLSRALVAERYVTPHGKDRRWHAHLYPIYMAEQVVKNSLLSREVIMASVRWHHLLRNKGG